MFTLPQLPYSPDALEPHLDEKTVKLHHDKHHQGYVDKLNQALISQPDLLAMTPEELMANLDLVNEKNLTAVKNNGGGHINHCLYWEIMTPAGGGQPAGDLATALIRAFGSLEEFKEKFLTTAQSQFASGWGWLVVDPQKKLKIYSTRGHKNPWMKGEVPILNVDVWEHAYYLKYQNRRGEHLEHFWQVINWPEVARRYQAAL